jgi:hypothetical protein
VARSPLTLKPADEGWTRGQVAEVVHGLIWDEFRIPRDQYTENSRWAEDMGIE